MGTGWGCEHVGQTRKEAETYISATFLGSKLNRERWIQVRREKRDRVTRFNKKDDEKKIGSEREAIEWGLRVVLVFFFFRR